MSYALEPEEDAGAGLMRTIAEQVDKLRTACADPGDPALFVHKARVRCKRIRAALRLARPLIGRKAYVRENAWWRDAARNLSAVRDMTARLEALSALARELDIEIGPSVVRRVRWQFDRELRALELGAGASEAIHRFCAAVRAHDLSVMTDIDEADADDLKQALGATYHRARKAMTKAYEVGSPEAFHEWRKQSKYHALQLRLARRLFPAEIDARIDAARDLAELLGGVQDVEVLAIGLADQRNSHHVIGALEVRRHVMLEGARIAGEALFARRRKDWLQTLDRQPVAPDL